jgi:hypothetical protein
MALSHSPKIVTDGLVFMYDTGNRKSYPGEPTTNLITSGGIDFSERSGYTNLQTSQVVDSRSPSGYACEMEILDGANINSAARSSFGQGTSMPSSGNAFVSILAKFEGGASSNITPKIYNGSGTAWQSLSPLDGGSAYLTSGYRRFGYYGAITANPGFSMAKGNSNKQTGQKTRWHSPQVELKSHATPFVNGTRSATQGLIDRTDTATIDISNASFDSNAQMVFDGTDDIINTGLFAGRNPSTQPFTIEAIVKSDTTSGGRMWLDATSNGTNQRLYCAHAATGTGNPMGIQGSAWSSSGVSDTDYHHYVIVMDGSVARLYNNGEAHSTKNYTSYQLQALNIGGRNTYIWLGDIPIFKLYDRALTADEVLKNYNATKSRFE